jgi:hypothetical protein
MKVVINMIIKILEHLRNCCKKRLIFIVVICLPILLIFCVNSCYFYDDIMGARITTKHDVCRRQIRQLAIAILAYVDANEGAYPPPVSFDVDGKAMHSWRALILPYMDKTLKYDYSVPWDHPNNIPLHNKMPQEFRCPCEAEGYKAHSESSYDMIFDFEKRDRIVKKGSRKNLMLIEVFNSGVNWLQPVSIDIADMSKGIKPFNDPIQSIRPGNKHPIASDNKRYFFYVNDYGELIELPTDISPKLLEILAERDNEQNNN